VPSDFENRLAKNVKHRFKWAQRQGLTAFRLFDLDIPEWPFAVDWYAGFVHVIEYPRRRQVREGTLEGARVEVLRALGAVLAREPQQIFTKTHEPKPWGQAPTLQRGQSSPAPVLVTEHGLTFECNLADYLDTGLFLDHRVTRERVMNEAAGTRFLNLFAYTGSFTVHARAGGAKATTTVDLSNTYCDWAERNLRHNGLAPSPAHQVLRADVLAWLEASPQGPLFDLAVVDPPTFSSSKKMGRRWEVQRDHRHLIEAVLARLAPGGALYFSTNFLNFELDARLPASTELTPKSIPEDFRRTVHRCWKFVRS
jgi:23S rRNA (cytosine1962-C5)-methyltransferase